MIVLSLFDGISCGRVALERAGFKIDTYYASEIKPDSIKITQKNYPDTIQLGDVREITEKELKELPKIDLLIFGSPCQNLSVTVINNINHNQGLKGEKSSLFYNAYSILKWLQKYNNPELHFLCENVASMKDKDRDIITASLGVEPILIDSALVSAQDRLRYYWTNIPNVQQPKDKGLVLKDIMESNVSEKYYYKKPFEFLGLDKKVCAKLQVKSHDIGKRVYNPDFKCWNVKQVCTMIKKGSIAFDNPLQRPSGQWKDDSKSLLIDSIFRMFVPDVYAIQVKADKGNVYDIIDGIQRLTTINSYINDEWALTELEPIKLESTNNIYNISGKKFSELPEEVQEELKGFSVKIKAIEIEEDEDEEEVVEMVFYRLNKGTPVSKEHLALTKAPGNVKQFCKRIMTEHALFTDVARYTESSIKKSDKQMTIMQSILLIAGIPFESFAAKHVEEVMAKSVITEQVLKRTEKAFTDIAETFKECDKKVGKFVLKVNIPIMAYMFAQTTNENKEQAKENLLNYIKGSKPGDNYRANTGSGSVKKEKVTGRVRVMLEICGVEVKTDEQIIEEEQELGLNQEERVNNVEEQADNDDQKIQTFINDQDENQEDQSVAIN